MAIFFMSRSRGNQAFGNIPPSHGKKINKKLEPWRRIETSSLPRVHKPNIFENIPDHRLRLVAIAFFYIP
jgi:hypothetical protein